MTEPFQPSEYDIEQAKAQFFRVMNNAEALIASLQSVCEKISAQTDAIQQLVNSNAMLIQAVAETAMDGEDMPPTTYMDGTPIK